MPFLHTSTQDGVTICVHIQKRAALHLDVLIVDVVILAAVPGAIDIVKRLFTDVAVEGDVRARHLMVWFVFFFGFWRISDEMMWC